jgi:hypothetical protein
MSDKEPQDSSEIQGAVPATGAIAPVAPSLAPVRVGANIRKFSTDCEALAEQWIKGAVLPMPWVEERQPALTQGVEGGLWVSAAPYRAYAKPRLLVDPLIRPIAAVEKIASDLAYYLALPVPPVTLWERLGVWSESRAVAVSAVPFAGVERWEMVQQHPTLEALVMPHCHAVMSKMFVFDTWLECYDHAEHPGNLLFQIDSAGDAVFAYIDYSWAMTHHWKGAGYQNGYVAPLYTQKANLSPSHVIEAIEAVESVPDAVINHVVERIPGEFLSHLDAQLIAAGLRYRRDHLRRMVSNQHTGVL